MNSKLKYILQEKSVHGDDPAVKSAMIDMKDEPIIKSHRAPIYTGNPITIQCLLNYLNEFILIHVELNKPKVEIDLLLYQMTYKLVEIEYKLDKTQLFANSTTSHYVTNYIYFNVML